MKKADEITLKAFLVAVEELDKTLSEAELNCLHLVGNNINANLGMLDVIAEQNPQLDRVYQEIRILLQDGFNKRNKSALPEKNRDIGGNSTEISNITFIINNANNISKESQNILKMERQTLIKKFVSRFSKG